MSATKKSAKPVTSPQTKKTPTKPKEKSPKKVVQDEVEIDEGEQMNIVDDNVPANAIAPPHSTRIRYKSRKLIVRVTLHKIPEKTLNFEPTKTHFYLDTFKFSKKYYLNFRYPRDLEVDVDNCDATLEYGILTAIFPITHITDAFEQSPDEQPKQKQSHKRKQDEAELKPKAANKKQKMTENGAAQPKKNQTSTDAVAADTTANKKQPKKTAKQSVDAMEVEDSAEQVPSTKTNKKQPAQGNGAKKNTKQAATGDEDQSEEQPQERKKKNFVSGTAMLDIADQINDAEDKKRATKVKKETQKNAFFEQQAKKKEEKKQKKEALRSKVLTQVLTKQKTQRDEEEELEQKVVPRRVSFGDSVKDNEKKSAKSATNGKKRVAKK